MSPPVDPRPSDGKGLRAALGVFKHGGRAIRLVWQTSRLLTGLLAGLTVVAGALPAAVAYAGKLIVDAVVAHDEHAALVWIAVEAGLVVAVTARR